MSPPPPTRSPQGLFTRGLFAHLLDAIVAVDAKNRVVGFNAAAERMFGYKAADMLGEDVAQLMPTRFRAGHARRVRAFIDRRASARRLGGLGSGLVGRRADGAEFPIDASVSVVSTARGRLVVAVIRDITGQTRAIQALQDRELHLRLAMDAANLGSAEIDVASGSLRATDAIAARLLGFGEDPALWKSTSFLAPIHPDDREHVGATVQSILRNDQVLDAEFRVVLPDGGVRWLYGRGRLRHGADGAPEAVYGVVMDIHERKLQEARMLELSQRVLVAQEEERRRIARELHDQVGQALTAALINLQLLPGGADSAPAQELRVTLGDVLQQVREMSLNLRPSMLDSLGLEPTLRWYLERQRVLGGFGVELACRGARLPPELETLVFRLVQEAMTNILRHARAQRVRVTVESDARHAVLTVSDDGVGFDPEEARLRASRGGSFGLVSMAERTQLAGGTLRFDSRPGQGTTLTADLPLGR